MSLSSRSAGSGVIALAAAAGIALLGGCTAAPTPTDEPSVASADGAWPIEIEHAYGTLELDAAPERIVTLGWAETDIVTVLGVEPVGAGRFAFTSDGVAPWLADHLTETPETVDTARAGTSGPELDVEAIALLKPDLIIATTYADLGKYYDQLEKIAPTLGPAQTDYLHIPWQEHTRAIAVALGETDEAEEVIADTEVDLAKAAEEHPEFGGLDYTLSLGTPDQIKVVQDPEDGGVKLLSGFGLDYSESALALPSLGDGSLSAGVSEENVAEIDADLVFIAWFGAETKQSWESSPLFGDLGAVQGGGYVPLELAELTALRNPSPLSLPFAVEHVLLDKAAEAISG